MQKNEQKKSKTLLTDKLHVENKTLFIDFKENGGGRFLQIAELSNDRRSTVVIPETGIEAFLDAVKKVLPALQVKETENA